MGSPQVCLQTTNRIFSSVAAEGPENIAPHICLLVLGPTGTGKSTFITRTLGCLDSDGSDGMIGHGLDSCKLHPSPPSRRWAHPGLLYIGTTVCKPYEYEESGTRFTLFDTPGFNDTTRDDMGILKIIATFLNSKELPPISGIIYTHRITDNRVTGSSRLNLEILKAISGEQFYPHVVLLTTMWDNIPNNALHEECNRREAQLLASLTHWGDLKSKGCRPMRFYGSQQSGIEVLRSFQSPPPPPRPQTQLEQEILAEIDIEKTKAGAIILDELHRREKQRQEELQEIKEEEELRVREERAQLARYTDREGFHSTSAVRRGAHTVPYQSNSDPMTYAGDDEPENDSQLRWAGFRGTFSITNFFH